MRDINFVAKCAEFLVEHESTPFEWGKFDCCLFVADFVKLQFGFDPAAAYRGHYSTEIGSIRALKKYGAQTTDLEKTWSYALNLKSTPGLAASRCDVVLVNTNNEPLIGVFFGSAVFAVSTNGLVRLDPSLIVCHWKLGALNA